MNADGKKHKHLWGGEFKKEKYFLQKELFEKFV